MRASVSWRRLGLLCALLLGAAALYAAVFIILYRTPPNNEQIFSDGGPSPPLNIYVSFSDMYPVREEVLVHVDFAAIEGKPHGVHYPGVPPRDLIVHVDDRNAIQDVRLPAGESAQPAVLSLSLNGSVGNYPFDQYDGSILISAAGMQSGVPQPVRLTVWPVMSSWNIRVEQAVPVAAAVDGVALEIRIARPASYIVIAIAVYSAMALLGISGLTIGSLAFLGIRRIEATLTGTLGAMVFAIPALRAALPGTPPLGGHADVLVFVWVELAVIIGLMLFVLTWARRGSSG
jgi:hypothetical protein